VNYDFADLLAKATTPHDFPSPNIHSDETGFENLGGLPKQRGRFTRTASNSTSRGADLRRQLAPTRAVLARVADNLTLSSRQRAAQIERILRKNGFLTLYRYLLSMTKRTTVPSSGFSSRCGPLCGLLEATCAARHPRMSRAWERFSSKVSSRCSKFRHPFGTRLGVFCCGQFSRSSGVSTSPIADAA